MYKKILRQYFSASVHIRRIVKTIAQRRGGLCISRSTISPLFACLQFQVALFSTYVISMCPVRSPMLEDSDSAACRPSANGATGRYSHIPPALPLSGLSDSFHNSWWHHHRGFPFYLFENTALTKIDWVLK